MPKTRTMLIAVLAIFSFAFLAWAAGEPSAANKTLKDLIVAQHEEAVENATYMAYAQKADAEGYGKLASLFRAAAKTEGIHAKTYADLIAKMNGKVEEPVVAREVKSTKENVQAVVADHAGEKGVKYVDFMKQAEAAGKKDVAAAFKMERAAEEPYVGLFEKANADLASWKGAKMDFYLCPDCGWACPSKPGKACPCGTPADKFIKIS